MALEIITLVNVPISSNCYILYDRTINNRCVIVDPSDFEVSGLGTTLLMNEFVPEYIILTHEHFDHILGCKMLLDNYLVKVIASRQCIYYVKDTKKNLSLFNEPPGFAIEIKDYAYVEDCENLNWNGHIFDFYLTPGHTEASITAKIGNFVFTGDSLIYKRKTVTKLPTGSKLQLKETFKLYETLKKRSMIIYPGHGEIFHLDDYDISDSL